MEKPQQRILRLELQIAAYLGDWIAHYEKAIQTLTLQEAEILPKVSNALPKVSNALNNKPNSQMPQVQHHGSQ